MIFQKFGPKPHWGSNFRSFRKNFTWPTTRQSWASIRAILGYMTPNFGAYWARWNSFQMLLPQQGFEFDPNFRKIIRPSISKIFCMAYLSGFLSWHGALQGPLTCLVRCFKRETGTPLGVPREASSRKASKIADANLDCAFVENALAYTDPWWWTELS